MDLLALRDQENLIHNQQTVAAAKPLNQGIRGLAPKTPGPYGLKSIVHGNKSVRNGQKGDENALPVGKTAKGAKTSFVTPVAHRERAPLGAKTTNVKARAFQTPAPRILGNGLQTTQQRTISARKGKLKIHQPELVQAEAPLLDDDDEEPEIEYCPPKIKELPDYPDDPFDLESLPPDFFKWRPPQGWADSYHQQRKNDDGDDSDGGSEKLFKESNERIDRILEEETRKGLLLIQGSSEESSPPVMAAPGRKQPANIPTTRATDAESKRRKERISRNQGPRDVDSKSAAAALATTHVPRFALPTTSTAAKASLVLSKPPSASSSPRGVPAAQRTLGYAAGRKVSSCLKQKPQQQQGKRQSIVPSGQTREPALGPNTSEEEGVNPSWLGLFDSVNNEDQDETRTSGFFNADPETTMREADELMAKLLEQDLRS